MNDTESYDYVMKTIKNRDVHFIRLWFVDVHGAAKSFATTPVEIEDLMEKGMGFDGNCIHGFSGLSDSEVLAFPDPTTFQILPWRPDTNAVARMFCTIVTPDGKPYEGDSRHILAQVVERAHMMGFEPNIGCDIEFYYFKNDRATEVLDEGGYFDLTQLDSASDLRRDTILTLEKMGISVRNSHHGRGPSQHGIALRDSDAMSMADAVITYKQVVKEIATQQGVYASFMPKPLEGKPGSGVRAMLTLYDAEGNNAFFDANDPLGVQLSDTGKHFLAGVLHYAPEYALLTNQLVNSYKRLVPRSGAPICVAWAPRNRSAMVRIPGYRPGDEETYGLELRSADPAFNPYLAFAAVLASGLRGITDELPLPDACEDADLSSLTRSEAEARGLALLPENLGAALRLFEASDLMKDTLGEHIHNYLVQAKRQEWDEYRAHVSSWELEHYLATV